MILTAHWNLLQVPRNYIYVEFKEEACTSNMPLKISQITATRNTLGFFVGPSHRVCLITVKADSHTACRAQAVPLLCLAAKGLECVFPIWFTQCGRVWFTLAMPCSDHAFLRKATAQHDRQEVACGLPARFRLLSSTTRSFTKIVIRSIPILLTTIHTYDCKEWH